MWMRASYLASSEMVRSSEGSAGSDDVENSSRNRRFSPRCYDFLRLTSVSFLYIHSTPPP